MPSEVSSECQMNLQDKAWAEEVKCHVNSAISTNRKETHELWKASEVSQVKVQKIIMLYKKPSEISSEVPSESWRFILTYTDQVKFQSKIQMSSEVSGNMTSPSEHKVSSKQHKVLKAPGFEARRYLGYLHR